MTQKIATCALAGLALLAAHRDVSQAQANNRHKPILITQPIDESKLIRLRGNTRPEARAEFDRGRVDDSLPLDHMLLQLKRAPELEQELDQYINGLTDKSSPNFRQWLTAAQQGEMYGPAQQDLNTITSWLQSYGFTVDYVYPNQMVIDFSGTAGDIRKAFHTEIHHLEVHGEQHIANMSDPQIPAALADVVVGVVSLHDFQPEQMRVPRIRANYTFSDCSIPTNSTGNNCYALVPADLATIYNLNPLFRLGINGTDQTITLVEDSDTYSNDVATYRSTFLSKWSGTVTTTHPSGGNTCADPGTNAADGEADLDAEVASAMAPDAAIVVATCRNSRTTNGVLFAVENLVNSATPPAIISQSYGECEAINGAAANAAFNSAFQTGAAAGTSIFVSAGDAGASGCAPAFAPGSTEALSGIGITGWGETVYNVSVGGTDFEDAYNAKETGTPISTYWNTSNNIIDGSAKSYVPEIPWNDSCSGYLLANYEGAAPGYGSSGECNAVSTFLSTAAAAGGPSGCATGGGGTDQTSYGVVDGTCAGYSKPSWQSGIFGNPADGVRDIPDVSLFASNGIWGHYVTICYSDSSDDRGGVSCAGSPSTWAGFGGTSVAAPMMAAIQALVNEKWSLTKVGNPDPTYYAIAESEFGSGGNSSCYSINQPPREGLASACAFYDITQGDNDIDCEYNGPNEVGCYLPSGTYGSLSTQSLASAGTVITGGSGYTSAPTCTFGAPSNLNAYQSPSGTTLWAGGTQATCNATVSGGAVTAITISNSGEGYAGGTSCTLTADPTGDSLGTPAISASTSPAVPLATGSTSAGETITGNSTGAAASPALTNCSSPLTIGSFTNCGNFFVHGGTNTDTLTTSYSPTAGNGILIHATWCSNSTCNAFVTTITPTISDNINSPETCFTLSPHSPYYTDNSSVPDYVTDYAFYCPSIPSGVTSFTITTSGTGSSGTTFLTMSGSEWLAGSIAPTGYFETVDHGTSSNNTPGLTATVPTNGATTHANDLIVSSISNCGGTINIEPGTGFTALVLNPTNNPGFITEAEAASSSGVQTATASWSGTTTSGNCQLGESGGLDTWYGFITPLVGGGTGATCSASPAIGTAPGSWQPAYGATPGWDFATGIGSVNAYNLVFNSAW